MTFKISLSIFFLSFLKTANHEEVMDTGSKREQVMLQFVTRMVQNIQDSI